MRLADLAGRVGAHVCGDGDTVVSHVATLEHAGPAAITFLANPRYRAKLATTGAAAVIVSPDDAQTTTLPKLLAANPYATFAKVAAILHPGVRPAPSIHPTAQIDATANVAQSVSIGACAVIGAHATIGERVIVATHCVIGEGSTLANDVVLHAGVILYPRTVVGERSTIHGGAVIGADGFGMAEEDGRWVRIPQIGRVIIGADVEVGANTTIDRGAIDDTVIEDDVKLDNQIQVGHNCRIGAHSAIAGCVGIAGSTRIGKNCKIGGAAMIGGHIEICDDAVVSGGTSVSSSIAAPGIYTGTVLALPHRQWQRVQASVRHLPDLLRRIRRLEG